MHFLSDITLALLIFGLLYITRGQQPANPGQPADPTAASSAAPAPASTCHIGAACSACKVGFFSFVHLADGTTVKVCCPNCVSKYFRYGNETATRGPWCDCDYIRLPGNCWRGEQCDTCNSKPNETTIVNNMPVCCNSCLTNRTMYIDVKGAFCFCDCNQ